MNADSALLSRAIVVWTGWGETPWPARERRRLVDLFGEETTERLVPQLQALTDEFYASDANLTAPNISEMGHMAAARFHELHPEISDDAVTALAWCYTFDNR